jgi:hypothetical protein
MIVIEPEMGPEFYPLMRRETTFAA